MSQGIQRPRNVVRLVVLHRLGKIDMTLLDVLRKRRKAALEQDVADGVVPVYFDNVIHLNDWRNHFGDR